MRLKPPYLMALVVYFATLALAWIVAAQPWRDLVFYLTFLSGFGLNAALGYLLMQAEKVSEGPP